MQRLPSREDLQAAALPVSRGLSRSMVAGAIFAIVAILVLSPAESWDRHVSMWLQGPAAPALTMIGAVTQVLFSAQAVFVLAAIAVVVFWIRGRWAMALSAAAVFPMVAMEVLLKYVIKDPPASTYLQVRTLFAATQLPAALTNGFPSGHASRAAFAIGWVVLALSPRRLRPAAAGAAVLITLAVCWTRIYVGDHSLFEILAGLALAAMFLFPAAALRWLPRRPARSV